jgi:hypothetical protein
MVLHPHPVIGMEPHEILMEQLISEIHHKTGWSRAQILDAIHYGMGPAEAQRLKTMAAQVAPASPGLHGIVQLGRHASPLDNFFSQFDPTWPKARFGSVVRQALVAAGSVVGVPVGPMIDSMAGMAQRLGTAPTDEGPPPPAPLPPIHPPAIVQPIHFREPGWSPGQKLMAAGAAVVVVGGIWYLFFRRTPNPRRRRRRATPKHMTARHPRQKAKGRR